VADVGEEEMLVDGDVGGVFVGGVDGALAGVQLPSHVRLATIVLVLVLILLYLILPLFVVILITITCM
jgi:hypothetical protein